MAGGKETPRQKLIGIMYLVLLAMLALSASKGIYFKFKFLDDSMKIANGRTVEDNADIEQSIEKVVNEGGKKPKDMKVFNDAKKVRDMAEKTRDQIEKVRTMLIDETGGVQDGMYKGLTDEAKTEEIMLGKKKADSEVKVPLNKFAKDVVVLLKKNKTKYEDKKEVQRWETFFKDICIDAKDDIRIPDSEKDEKKKSFAELNFGHHTPMVAALAFLSDLESKVLKYETEALAILSRRVGAEEIKFDKIQAVYNADSKVVASGTKFKAELFLAASASSINPTFTFGGKELEVKEGRGQIEFKAGWQGGKLDPKTNTYEFNKEAQIKFKIKDKILRLK